ncbi:MAG: hypothetical protein ACI915_005593 [Gammaproteobacteria bacterium]
MVEPDMGPAKSNKHSDLQRFVFNATRGPLHLRPTLAERPDVTRPEAPVHVAANESVAIYMSTPLQVQLAIDVPPLLLEDVFVSQPSDTWFDSVRRHAKVNFATQAPLELIKTNKRWSIADAM